MAKALDGLGYEVAAITLGLMLSLLRNVPTTVSTANAVTLVA